MNALPIGAFVVQVAMFTVGIVRAFRSPPGEGWTFVFLMGTVVMMCVVLGLVAYTDV